MIHINMFGAQDGESRKESVPRANWRMPFHSCLGAPKSAKDPVGASKVRAAGELFP